MESNSIPLDAAETRLLRVVLGDVEAAQKRVEDTVSLIMRGRSLEGRYRLSQDLTQIIPVEGEPNGSTVA